MAILLVNELKNMLRIQKSTTEAKLLAACRKGDRKAQRTLYERYSPVMYAICRRYIKELDEAEDILIKSFTRIFEKLDQYKGEGSFEGWMRRIVVNESLGHLRRTKMYVEVDVEYADREPDYQYVQDHLEAEDLMKLVNELPPGYRSVFNLFAIEGYSHQEIAETLGISENTSKSQLSRARALLQRQLVALEDVGNEKTMGHE